MLKIGAVINKESGTLSRRQREVLLEEVRTHLEPRVWQECLAFVPGKQVENEMERLINLGIDVLIIGGGDGTISTAAKYLSGTEIALAIIGLGTRNHFARDLKIPLDCAEAICLLDQMHLQWIDLGEVNGHFFINNVTLGVYPKIIEKREETMKKHGWKKWRSHFAAALSILWGLPKMRLIVESPSFRSDYLTPLLFIGNNEYDGTLITDPKRISLRDGKLWICMTRISGVWSLVRMVCQIALRGVQASVHVEIHLDELVTVHSGRKKIEAGIDGEKRTFANPLRFRIRKKALRVVVP